MQADKPQSILLLYDVAILLAIIMTVTSPCNPSVSRQNAFSATISKL